jgi:hypothetical protein
MQSNKSLGFRGDIARSCGMTVASKRKKVFVFFPARLALWLALAAGRKKQRREECLIPTHSTVMHLQAALCFIMLSSLGHETSGVDIKSGTPSWSALVSFCVHLSNGILLAL